jgi:hypothetical protein
VRNSYPGDTVTLVRFLPEELAVASVHDLSIRRELVLRIVDEFILPDSLAHCRKGNGMPRTYQLVVELGRIDDFLRFRQLAATLRVDGIGVGEPLEDTFIEDFRQEGIIPTTAYRDQILRSVLQGVDLFDNVVGDGS